MKVDDLPVPLRIDCPTCRAPVGVACSVDGWHFAREVKGEYVAAHGDDDA